MKKKICVIGLGYIGLPTSIVFANNNWNVIGVDVKSTVVDGLNKGQVHIKEEGIDEAIKNVLHLRNFQARTSPVTADVYIISVPTPYTKDLKIDLKYVENAVESILPVLNKGNILIIESTIPPRTTRDVVAPIIERAGFKPGEDIYLAHCPERVLPGRIFVELYENNRIVGGINEISAQKAADVYRTFVKGKVIETSAESAEMSKLMENTYRDVNIALANELTKVSEKLGVDALEVISLANEHPRVNIHQPGPGVGGHCLAVDPYFIIERDLENTLLIRNARAINESMPDFIVKQVKKVIDKSDKIAIFGLAYKGDVDDIRNSPSLSIIEKLNFEGYNVKVYDPYVKQEQVDILISTYEETLNNADLLLILTDHSEFKKLQLKGISKFMNKPLIIDTKNCLKNDGNNTLVKYINFSNLFELNKIKKVGSEI